MIGAIASHYVDTPVTYGDVVLADSPAMYLPLQDTSGTTATDASGNGRNGTYVNGVSLNNTADGAPPTALGTAVRFDGTNDHILLAAGSWLDPTAGFTFEGWFRIRSWSNWMRIFDFANAASTTDMTFAANSSGFMYVAMGGSDSGNLTRFSTGTWIHVWLTVSAAGAMELYANNVLWASSTVGAPTTGTRNLKYIGRSAYSDPYLAASVTHLAIYHTVLGSDRRAAHYSAGTA